MSDLRSTQPNHVAQLRQLEAFVESTAEFAQGVYQAWTSSAKPKLSDARLELRSSTLVPGCTGVFATQAIEDGQVIAYYHGVLMTELLWQEFWCRQEEEKDADHSRRRSDLGRRALQLASPDRKAGELPA
jgi:hypothetical protein